MAITDDLRKTLTDPTPLYFAAGTADLALQQAKRVPGLMVQLGVEAPARLAAVRRTDPKEMQEKAAARAKEVQGTVQTAVTELLDSLDTDLKKLGENAQGLALRGVGAALEYAVKARETYEKVAEHGEQTVRTWRGVPVDDQDRADAEPAAAVAAGARPGPVAVPDEDGHGGGESGDAPSGAAEPASGTARAGRKTARPATPRRTVTKKTAVRRNGTSTRKAGPSEEK